MNPTSQLQLELATRIALDLVDAALQDRGLALLTSEERAARAAQHRDLSERYVRDVHRRFDAATPGPEPDPRNPEDRGDGA